MICKCTNQECNPCTNITRLLDLCPECILLGHINTQTIGYAHNGKINLKTTLNKKIDKNGEII